MRGLFSAGCACALLALGAPPGAAQEYYGAIAYSPTTRAHGWAMDLPTREEAKRRALRQCQRYGPDCEVPVWFRNACGALAVGADGYGSGWGGSQKAAEGSAMQTCARFSGGCWVIRWVCTSR